jgi:hypothetical protein
VYDGREAAGSIVQMLQQVDAPALAHA